MACRSISSTSSARDDRHARRVKVTVMPCAREGPPASTWMTAGSSPAAARAAAGRESCLLGCSRRLSSPRVAVGRALSKDIEVLTLKVPVTTTLMQLSSRHLSAFTASGSA